MGSVGHRIVLLGLGVVLISVVVMAHQGAAVVQLVPDTGRTLPSLPRFEMWEPWAGVWRALPRDQLLRAHDGTTMYLFLFGIALVLAVIAVSAVRNLCGQVRLRPWLSVTGARLLLVWRSVVDSAMRVRVSWPQRQPALSPLPLVRPLVTSPGALTNVPWCHPLPVICDEELPIAEQSTGGSAPSLSASENAPGSVLSEREREIVCLLAHGYSNLQIAVELTITVLTVKRHLSNIYGKLHVNDRRSAVAYAQHHGLV